ncbi:MAG: Fic family protein [Candidatus Moranbacteria bacterium]|nr:Fic family protein [Candidatus Moranbacteria bacterium]
MINLTKRQSTIFGFIRGQKGVGTREIKAYTERDLGEVFSRVTIIRDMDFLLENKLIKKEGMGRSVLYFEAVENKLLSYFNVEEYFKKTLDERVVTYPNFNFEIFDNMAGLFNDDELSELQEINNFYEKRVASMSETIFKKELERLTIELSWKSSQIEGNTYSLIDTEILIRENKEAEGHEKEEAVMILNHKKALDYVLNNKEVFSDLTVRKIEDLHALIVGDLNVATGLRKGLVGITGTIYRPLDNQYQIKEVLEKTISAIGKIQHPLEKALMAILMISYIQPFEDGNKRTARILGNAILMAYGFCPLSYRSVNESDYKKAILLFYEQNSALFFKELFVEQFKFAINNYFLA